MILWAKRYLGHWYSMKQALEDIVTLLDTNKIETSFTDVADLLWLYSVMGGESKSSKARDKEEQEKQEKSQHETVDNQDREDEESNQESTHTNNKTPLHSNNNKNGSSKGEYFKAPTRKQFNQFNQFATVFKILKQFSDSSSDYVFDENETIEYIANTNVWSIKTAPQKEFKYTLFIIIEKSTSMRIWEEITREFVSALSRFSFFKDVKVIYLKEEDKEYQLYRDKNCTKKVSTKLFNSQSQRTLTILLSDCISKGWQDKRGYSFLDEVTVITPFLIINMLPQRVWNRTIVNDSWRVKFTHREGWKNKNLISDVDDEEDIDDILEEHIRVPMTTLEKIPLKHWSNLIAGYKNNWLHGSLFEAEVFDIDIPSKVSSKKTSSNNISPEQQVKNFYAYASPLAHELAIYFSAVDGLSMEIMKMVQKTSLPKTNHTHLAEVFLSGLLKRDEFKTKSNDDTYQFKDGIKDVLSKRLPDPLKEKIRESNSEFIKEHLGHLQEFQAVVESEDSTDGVTIEVNSDGFANIDNKDSKVVKKKTIVKPAVYKTVTERIQTSPAKKVWKKTTSNDPNIEEKTELIDIPAEYKMVTKRVMVSPEREEEVEIHFDDTEEKIIDMVISELLSMGWNKKNILQNYKLPSNKKVDILLRDNKKNLALIEVKAPKFDVKSGLDQAILYGKELGVDYVYSTNGVEIYGYSIVNKVGGVVTGYRSLEELNGQENILDNKYHEIVLNYNQKELYEKILENIQLKKKRMIVNLYTKFGRYSVVHHVLKKLFSIKWNLEDKERKPKILFLTSREEFVTRMVDMIKPLDEKYIQLNYYNSDKKADIFLSTYNNMVKIYNQYNNDFFDIVIIDNIPQLNRNSNIKRMLTYFGDSSFLCFTSQFTEDMKLFFGEVIYDSTISQEIDIKKTYIKDIVSIRIGKSLPLRESIENESSIPFIRVSDLKKNMEDMQLLEADEFHRVNERDIKSNFTLVNEECILFSSISHNKHKPTIFRPTEKMPSVYIGQDVYVLICDKKESPLIEYLYFQLYSNEFEEQASMYRTGSTMSRLNNENLKKVLGLFIPLVSIEEQKKYVNIQKSKIDVRSENIDSNEDFDTLFKEFLNVYKKAMDNKEDFQIYAQNSVLKSWSLIELFAQKIIQLNDEEVSTSKKDGFRIVKQVTRDNNPYLNEKVRKNIDDKFNKIRIIRNKVAHNDLVVNKIELEEIKKDLGYLANFLDEYKGRESLDYIIEKNDKDNLNPKELFYQDLNNIKRFLKLLLTMFQDNLLEEKINNLEGMVSDLNYRVSAYDFGFIDFILAEVNMIDYPDIFTNDNKIIKSTLENPKNILIKEINKTSEFLISLYKHLSYEEDYLKKVQELEYKKGSFDKEINEIISSSDELINTIQKLNLEELSALLNKNNIIDKTDKALTPIEEVVNYLKQNKNSIIISILEKLENNRMIYIDELKEKKIEFIESINKHFDWMIELLHELDDKKNSIDNLSIIDSLYPAYCDFYRDFSLYIENIEHNTEVKKILKGLSSSISERYKCN
jgi:hypothetical protein